MSTTMELRKLDALVAEKVMGWRMVTYTAGGEQVTELAPPDGDLHRAGRWPNYSTEIEDAWLVVEKLRPRIWRRMAIDITAHQCQMGFTLDHEDGPHGSAIADTAPLAICRAALAALSPKHSDQRSGGER